MQPIPISKLTSPLQLNDTHPKMITHSPLIFRPYNHYPTAIAPTFNTLSTNEPRVSAFKVVGKRPNTSEITSDTPLKLCRTESNSYSSIDLSKLLAPLNRDGDSKFLSMSNVYDSTSRSGELNGICPLNLKKNTLNHETVTHAMRDSNFEMACDLTTQQQQQKLPNTYQTDVNLSKPFIPYGYTAQGKFCNDTIGHVQNNIYIQNKTIN